jgi:predicted RNase H-like HicB family nuclease
MERIVNLQIERLPEGCYLATSNDIQGLVVQGNSVMETIEIAKDVAKKLIEAHEEQITTIPNHNGVCPKELCGQS